MEYIPSLRGVIHFNARIFCDNKGALLLARQKSYSSRNTHLAIRFLRLRNWIMDEQLVIDHVLTKGQLSGIFFLRSYFWIVCKNVDSLAFLFFF